MPTKNFNRRKNIKLYTDEPQKISMLTSILKSLLSMLFDYYLLWTNYYNCVKKTKLY